MLEIVVMLRFCHCLEVQFTPDGKLVNSCLGHVLIYLFLLVKCYF